jgi:GNAT superfamily N-acetyltransferase
MKLQKVFSTGKILNLNLYKRLQVLDRTTPSFRNCENEFLENRDWWVMTNNRNQIIAYCGSIYRDGICIFNRAWVHKRYRGEGIQKRLINIRLRAAKRTCYIAITYTIKQNYPSINNLIKCGFKIYGPAYEYGGPTMLYWQKLIR